MRDFAIADDLYMIQPLDTYGHVRYLLGKNTCDVKVRPLTQSPSRGVELLLTDGSQISMEEVTLSLLNEHIHLFLSWFRILGAHVQVSRWPRATHAHQALLRISGGAVVIADAAKDDVAIGFGGKEPGAASMGLRHQLCAEQPSDESE
jgi:hypothetical protein